MKKGAHAPIQAGTAAEELEAQLVGKSRVQSPHSAEIGQAGLHLGGAGGGSARYMKEQAGHDSEAVARPESNLELYILSDIRLLRHLLRCWQHAGHPQ